MDEKKVISPDNLRQYSEETSGKIKEKIAEHTDNTNVHVTTADKSKWNGKFDSNQGTSNAGKLLGTNSNGDVVAISGYGFEYNEETKMLEYGTDPTTNLNQGIGLDDTLSKKGYAAEASAVGELKSDLVELSNVIDNDKKVAYLNLFDMNTIIDNAYIGINGETVEGNIDYFITDYIKVYYDETICVDTLNLQTDKLWIYNLGKNPVRKIELTEGKWKNESEEPFYVRFCYIERTPTEKVIYKQRILFVGKGGYSKINEAISDCDDGDIIRVRSGVYYNENNTADSTNGFKRYYLVGDSRESTIIINSDENYLTGAFCFRGYSIENITIINKRYSWQTIPSQPAYALHTDFGEIGDKMVIRNCRFESHFTSAVGIGTAKDCNYIFENCEFISKTGINGVGAVYFHNATNASYNGNPITGDNQRLSFINCTFTTDTDTALRVGALDIQDNNLTVTFINNNLYASGNDNATPVPIPASKMNGIPIDQPSYYKYLCGWFVMKHNRSYGNNVEMLNAGKPIVVID